MFIYAYTEVENYGRWSLRRYAPGVAAETSAGGNDDKSFIRKHTKSLFCAQMRREKESKGAESFKKANSSQIEGSSLKYGKTHSQGQ